MENREFSHSEFNGADAVSAVERAGERESSTMPLPNRVTGNDGTTAESSLPAETTRTDVSQHNPNGLHSEEQPTEGTDEAGDDAEILGSSLRPDATYRIVKLQLREPELDQKFVLAAAFQGAPDGERRVANHHAAIFRSIHGTKIKVLEEQQGTRARDVAGRERDCSALSRELNRTERFHVSEASEGANPWTLHDRIDVGILAFTALAACGFGICNSTNLLRSSGDAMFSTILKTLPFTMTLLLGAIGLKAIGRLFQAERHLRIYGWAIFLIGLVSCIAWLVCFTQIFGPILTSTQDLLTQYLGHDSNAGSTQVSPRIIMLAGGLADAFLAAGAWTVCHLIMLSHRLATASETPEWKEKRRMHNLALKRLNEARNLLGIVRGELEREQKAEATFVNRAVEFYRLAAAQNAMLKGLMK
jgi:hypothetical protein